MTRIVVAVCAVVVAVAVVVATQAAVGGLDGAQSAGPVPGTLAAPVTGASIPNPEVPSVDYTIDLDTGLMTPLPEAIIKSLGPNYVGISIYDRLSARYAFSSRRSQLAYIGENPADQSPQLFLASIDGTGIRQLTFGDPPGPICCAATPAWSPDGTKVVFDAPQGVYIVDVASGTLTRVVPPDFTKSYEYPRDPSFSPDGTRIIYTDDGVRAVPVVGGPSTLLFGGGTGGMSGASNAAVSPDGSRVTMFGHIGGSCCYRVLGNIDGTEIEPLGNVDGIGVGFWGVNVSGAWSPNGDRIVSRADIDSIAVFDVTTGQTEVVARGNGAIWLDDHTLLVEVS